MKKTTSNMSIILVDKRNMASGTVDEWLRNGGFETLWADDLGHAIEALSDFTVRMRPDIVLLEVPSLAKNFDSLHSAFQLSSQNDDVVVLALSDEKAPAKKRAYFANDLAQLKTAINKNHATYCDMA